MTLDDTYEYTVTAVDGAGNESAPSSAATVLFDHTPPPPPSGLNGPTPSQSKPGHDVGVGRPRCTVRLRVLRDLP